MVLGGSVRAPRPPASSPHIERAGFLGDDVTFFAMMGGLGKLTEDGEAAAALSAACCCSGLACCL